VETSVEIYPRLQKVSSHYSLSLRISSLIRDRHHQISSQGHNLLWGTHPKCSVMSIHP
jgi:hypothetical protein